MNPDNPDAGTPEKQQHRRTPTATPAVQAWLDGEASREGLASADEQETAAFWTKVNDEAEMLEAAGVNASRIHVAGLCTKSHTGVLHSYRADKEKAGRMVGVIRPRQVLIGNPST